LKLVGVGPDREDHRTLRGSQAAAPLKLMDTLHGRVRVDPLRGSQAAAPLKPADQRGPDRSMTSPRLTSRGPIEATRRRTLVACPECSPRLTSRGPIEACSNPHSMSSVGSLRGSQAAAPLKQRHFELFERYSRVSAAHKPRPH